MASGEQNPLVSVVLPVFNGAALAGQAIESALAQTDCSLEVIAIDDGSSDGSLEMLRRFGDRIRVLEQRNLGVGAARAAGVRAARGELIAFLDQDDWWLPGKLARQVAALSSDDRLGLAHTEVRYFDEARQQFTGPLNPDARPERLTGDCFDELLLENHVRNSSVLARASVLRGVGFDTGIAGNSVQDYELWLKVAQVSQLAYLDEPLTVIRLHPDQGTWDRRRMLGDEAELLERIAADVERTPVFRERMARLYDSLGVAHLDAADLRSARPCFRRSLGWRPTLRAGVLYLLTCCPRFVLQGIRSWRGRGAEPSQGASQPVMVGEDSLTGTALRPPTSTIT